MGSGGGGGDDPKMSHEMKKLYEMAAPLARRMATSGLEGRPLWDVPDMPSVPGPVMPTREYYQNLDPSVKAGLWAPYEEAGQQLSERMMSMGQGGSQRAGASGSMGAALGGLAAKGAQQVGLQAWQMTAPQMQQYRDEIYGAALQQRGEVMQAQQAPYSLFPGYLGGMGQIPSYMTPNRPSPWMGAAGGAATGAAMGSTISPGWGTAIGGLAGGIYGYYAGR